MKSILATLCLALATLTAAHAGTTGSLAGYLRDERTDLPVANVMVRYVSRTQQLETKTNAAGFYVFISLDPGLAILSVEKAGYEFGRYYASTNADVNARFGVRLCRCFAHGYWRPRPTTFVSPGQALDTYVANVNAFKGYPDQLMMTLQLFPGVSLSNSAPDNR